MSNKHDISLLEQYITSITYNAYAIHNINLIHLAEGVYKKFHSLWSLIMNLDSGFPRNWKLIDGF